MCTLFATSIAMMCCVIATASDTLHPLSDEFIDLINAQKTTWQAGRNFHPKTPMESFKNLMGLIKTDTSNIKFKVHDAGSFDNFPENFDPRLKWPNCPSLNEIRDQADCGSCWAFAGVTSMTDRICIHSEGKKQFHVSATDVVTCGTNNGCQGNFLGASWFYWESEGIVSGGNYGTNEGCKPYIFSPCEHYGVHGNRRNCSSKYVEVTPKCETTCQSNYDVAYEDDKIYGTVDYIEGEEEMQYELFHNGPIECAFTVHEDLLSYKSGVYQHVQGKFVEPHAIRVIGWGVENGVKYWLCANSWNTDWGDKGFFKILRGENHLGIENMCACGLPLLE